MDMVPEEVWANLPPDPEITELEERRGTLKQGQYRIQGLNDEAEIRELTETIRTKRDRREKRVLLEHREYYFCNSPTWDIEKQARGDVVEKEEYADPAIDLVIPECARLAELLCHQPEGRTEDQIFRGRIEATDLMVFLCDKGKTAKSDRGPSCSSSKKIPGLSSSLRLSQTSFPCSWRRSSVPAA